MPTYIREAELTHRRRKTLHDAGEAAFPTVRSSSDVAPIERAMIGTRLTESLIVLVLDGKTRSSAFTKSLAARSPRAR